MTQVKYSSLVALALRLSQNIHLFALKAFGADSSGWSTSQGVRGFLLHSLDLLKAFDRVHWPTLWEALREQGVPEHLVWLLENAYDEQLGGHGRMG